MAARSGFVAGSVYDLDHVCSRLARLGGVTVASLQYRLAPEHPFPAALHDSYDAMCWLAEHGRLIGGDGRLAAGGLSAGAALVAGACLMAREGGPVLTRQVLCYPALDFGQDTESVRGVELTHVEYAGTMHGFLNFSGVLSAGDHAIELIAADLARL